MNKKTTLWAGGTAVVAVFALSVGGSFLPALANTMPEGSASDTPSVTPMPEVVDPTETVTPETVDPTEIPVPVPDEEAEDSEGNEEAEEAEDSEDSEEAEEVEEVEDAEDAEEVEDADEGRRDNHGLETSEAAHDRNAIRHEAHNSEKADKASGQFSDGDSKH